MPRLNRLPARFPADTRYVLEAHGAVVRRFIEYPDGLKVELKPRKALTCLCADSALVPPLDAGDRASKSKRKAKRLAAVA